MSISTLLGALKNHVVVEVEYIYFKVSSHCTMDNLGWICSKFFLPFFFLFFGTPFELNTFILTHCKTTGSFIWYNNHANCGRDRDPALCCISWVGWVGGEIYTLGTRATHMATTGQGDRLDTGRVVQGGKVYTLVTC